MTIRRWDPKTNGGAFSAWMENTPTGKYVLASDHQSELASLRDLLISFLDDSLNYEKQQLRRDAAYRVLGL